MVFPDDRDPPAPAGVHGLRGGVRPHRAGLRDGGDDRAIAEEAGGVARERGRQRRPEEQGSEPACVHVEVETDLVARRREQRIDAAAVRARRGLPNGRFDVADPAARGRGGEERNERRVIEMVGEL